MFDKVKREHILQGIKDFEEKGYPNGFGPSSTYDLIYEGKRYPPKAIMAYANYHAEGRTIERYFKGGIGTDCFTRYEQLGFNVEEKNKADMELLLSKKEIEKCKKIKIGTFVRKTLPYILENNLISQNSVNELEDFDYCTANFNGMRFSILKKVDNSKSNLENRTVKGYSRYYSTLVKVDNEKYLITSEWYDRSFDDYIKFLNSKVEKSESLNNIINDLIAKENIKYWLYSPGRQAEYWDIFYNEGVMAIGWDALGDLTQYNSREEIYDALKEAYGGDGNKMNNVSANDDFVNKINIGDIVIVKKGRGELLGFGVVTSDYYFDDNRIDYKSCRKVDWKQKGNWKVDFSLVLKTLTDITQYDSDEEDYDKYYDRLLGIMKGEIKENITKSKPMHATNQILYGPPGTGKTFYLKEHLFDAYTIKETSISKEKYFEDTVAKLTWWQVTAIALIEMGTSRVNNILDNRWVSKKTSFSESKNVSATIWGTLQMHTIAESETVAYTQRQVPLIFDKNEDKSWQLIESELKEQAPELYETLDAVNNFKADPNTTIKHYDFVTFHQSFAYEDFIEGIKPILPDVDGDESKDLGYTIEDGVFKSLCAKAAKDPANRYAIFIDEINRGNVSAIFGELITLIETDKRLGAKNELKIKLPYSKKEFGVPSNLDIYGTMNTADRSVEALDTALRRRFEFKEMMPDYNVIANENVEGIQLADVLEKINQRIELLIDRDHTIGHSYFVNVKTAKALANAFNNKIVPLLQEYFYGDYGKIGLVLGKGFIEKTKNDSIEFASFNYDNANDFKTATFVLKQLNSDTIVEAVNLLLGHSEVKETK